MTANSLISRARTVAFQGEPGAYANLAARECLAHAAAIPKPTFEDAIAAVREGSTDLAIIPIENSLHGRIADIHHLLPDAGLYIVGEHFHRVRHQLLGMKGATLAGLKTVLKSGAGTRPVPQAHPRNETHRAELARHGGVGAPCRRIERPLRRRACVLARRGHLRPRNPQSRRRRRNRTT